MNTAFFDDIHAVYPTLSALPEEIIQRDNNQNMNMRMNNIVMLILTTIHSLTSGAYTGCQ